MDQSWRTDDCRSPHAAVATRIDRRITAILEEERTSVLYRGSSTLRKAAAIVLFSAVDRRGSRMKMKKTAWHYRFLKFMDYSPNDNFCPYCRQVVGGMLIIALITVLGSMAIFLFTYPLWRWVLFVDSGGVFGFFSGAAWFVFSWFVFKLYHEEWETSLYYLENPTTHNEHGMLNMLRWYHRQLIPKRLLDLDYSISLPRPPHDSIVLERMRAAHDKICPTIEFVE